MLTAVSLGAGVQSTTLVLMAAHGEIQPMPDLAIFADTGSEPAAVYAHLAWLMSPNVLPFPVRMVKHGDLKDDIGKAWASGKSTQIPIPAFVGDGGGMLSRSCTRDYKIRPVRRTLREILEITGKRSPKEVIAVQWLGISLDEAQRMRTAEEEWLANRYPLIEMRRTRNDCLRWLEAHGYPRPPKSACTFCPFHDDEQWRALTPAEFAEAVEIDVRMRNGLISGRSKGSKRQIFLHRSRKPLSEVDLSAESAQLNMFGNECEGMCGV